MNAKKQTAAPVAAPIQAARRFAAQAEVTIADLEKRVPTGMGPLERTLAERIRAAIARLGECVEQIAADGLIVEGSTGQRRPHQLLKTEQELRREIDDGLCKLVFRAENTAMFKQAQALTRKGGERS